MKTITKTKIHTTIGVYPNGDMKLNGVIAFNLANHIEYNKSFRPGRALFVDGKCEYRASLIDEQVAEYERLFQSEARFTLDKDTAPYH